MRVNSRRQHSHIRIEQLTSVIFYFSLDGGIKPRRSNVATLLQLNQSLHPAWFPQSLPQYPEKNST